MEASKEIEKVAIQCDNLKKLDINELINFIKIWDKKEED